MLVSSMTLSTDHEGNRGKKITSWKRSTKENSATLKKSEIIIYLHNRSEATIKMKYNSITFIENFADKEKKNNNKQN